MANLDQDLEAALVQLRQFNQLATPNQTQKDQHQKLLGQCVARLIFARLNHPDDQP